MFCEFFFFRFFGYFWNFLKLLLNTNNGLEMGKIFFGVYWIVMVLGDYWIFFFFLDFFGFSSKLLRLLLKVIEVATEHEKLSKVS